MLYLKSVMPSGETVIVSPIGEKYIYHSEDSPVFNEIADDGHFCKKQNMAIISDCEGESEWVALDRFMDHYIIHDSGDTLQVLARNRKPCHGSGGGLQSAV